MRYMTAGESHNKGLVAILEGLPANIKIDEDKINYELKLRQGGYGRGKRMEIEQDTVEILSGLRMGKTTGSPISMVIQNNDWENYKDVYNKEGLEYYTPRPGHADFAGMLKYNFSDCRNVLERASARETAARVAVGSICLQLLECFNVRIISHVKSLGPIMAENKKELNNVYQSPVYCADEKAEKKMIDLIDEAKEIGDSLGGTVETIIENLPPGLGDYTNYENRLDARIAGHVMSIPSVKGIEFGIGISGVKLPGSKYHDSMQFNAGISRQTNNAGGIEGGMTNGEPILFTVAVKPIPTVKMSLDTFDIRTKENCKTDYQRSDTTVLPAASVVIKNVAAFEVAKTLMDKFGGDDIADTIYAYEGYLKRIEEYIYGNKSNQ